MAAKKEAAPKVKPKSSKVTKLSGKVVSLVEDGRKQEGDKTLVHYVLGVSVYLPFEYEVIEVVPVGWPGEGKPSSVKASEPLTVQDVIGKSAELLVKE